MTCLQAQEKAVGIMNVQESKTPSASQLCTSHSTASSIAKDMGLSVSLDEDENRVLRASGAAAVLGGAVTPQQGHGKAAPAAAVDKRSSTVPAALLNKSPAIVATTLRTKSISSYSDTRATLRKACKTP